MELRLAAHPSSASRSRHWVAFLARQHGARADQVHTLELLTSELVTNALRRSADGDVLTVALRREQGSIVVTVTDGASGIAEPRPAPDVEGGGVGLVAALSTDWGVRVLEEGTKAVWFRLALSAVA